MEAKEARQQAERAYSIYVTEVLQPYMNQLLQSIYERIEMRTLDKKFRVNIVVPLQKIYVLSPSRTPYNRVKKEAMDYLFTVLQEKGFEVGYRLGGKCLSAVFFKYVRKSPYVWITW